MIESEVHITKDLLVYINDQNISAFVKDYSMLVLGKYKLNYIVKLI